MSLKVLEEAEKGQQRLSCFSDLKIFKCFLSAFNHKYTALG